MLLLNFANLQKPCFFLFRLTSFVKEVNIEISVLLALGVLFCKTTASGVSVSENRPKLWIQDRQQEKNVDLREAYLRFQHSSHITLFTWDI